MKYNLFFIGLCLFLGFAGAAHASLVQGVVEDELTNIYAINFDRSLPHEHWGVR